MTAGDEDGKTVVRRRSRSTPSLADVAREAGVAPITASRVANGAENVEEDTRQRVLDAMAKLAYRPNLAARALVTGQFKSIGVLTTSMREQGNMWTIGEIVTAAADQGYSVTLLPFDLQGDTVTSAYDRLQNSGVDGVIVVAERQMVDERAITLPAGIPVIFIDAGGSTGYTVVDADQAGGAVLATEHLLDLGHKTVHHISGPRQSFAATRRVEAWRETLERHGKRVPKPVVGDWTSRSGHSAARALLDDGATAVFASNDQMAFGFIQRVADFGIVVPDHISVVGFDDFIDADTFLPPLTTVHQSFSEIGRVAIEQLLNKIVNADGEPRTVLVPVHLVVRKSTAPPPR